MKENYIASVSFGKDSVAMLLMLIEREYPLTEVMFYDTGVEFNAIYHVRDQILPILEEKGIKFTTLRPERPFMYDMLEKPVSSKQKGDHLGYGWCGGLCRWGTREKLNALDRYAKEKDALVYIGIAADEPQRLTRMETYKKAPLAEWNVAEAEALSYCRAKGIKWIEDDNQTVDLYDILDRVSCWCCCNKNQKELRQIYLNLPEYWNKLIELQSRLERPMKRFRTDPEFGDLGDIRNLGAYWAAKDKEANRTRDKECDNISYFCDKDGQLALVI
jgi:3'-phosphoadenosine 5'-phosphosulfate sulfotransferase (PAPS reductase)/FAD synthetase